MTPNGSFIAAAAAAASILILSLGVVLCQSQGTGSGPRLGDERIVFQTTFGELELALYPDVAPVTAAHILKLAKLGGYNTNHFFRVDKGFVAQTAGVAGGRTAPLNPQQQAEESKTVPLEVQRHVKHDKRGILSMGRLDDPNSGGSSFSILLGPAPHLDMNYGIFGEVTKGFETLTAMEGVETITEGIFVMPKERISIVSSYVYSTSGAESGVTCEDQLAALQARFEAQAHHMHQMRSAKLP